jgi:hypothetical protein
MLSMVRAIARTPTYRDHARALKSRTPDDVWHDAGASWIVVYQLTAPGEQMLCFRVEEPSAAGPARIASAVCLSRATPADPVEVTSLGR